MRTPGRSGPGRSPRRAGTWSMRLASALAILPLLAIALVTIAVQLAKDGDHVVSVSCSQAPPAQPTARQFPAAPSPDLSGHALWRAVIRTNCGTITLQLDGLDAPQAVASFVFLARHGYWRDSPCHRITTERTGMLLLQCGDPTGTGLGNPGYTYGLENAPTSGQYPRGTVAMAHGDDPDGNGGQFYIFYGDTRLPFTSGGYSIFGRVEDGMEVLDAVAAKKGEDSQPDFHPFQPFSFLSVRVHREG